MEQRQSKRRIWAVGVTIALHTLFLGLLHFLFLERSEPERSAVPELVLVDLGDVPQASGDTEPAGREQEGKEIKESPAPTPSPTPPAPKPVDKMAKPKPTPPVQTQTHEKSLPVVKPTPAEIKQKKEAELAEALRREEEARQRAERIAAEQEAKRQAEQRKQVGNSISGAFSGKGSGSGSQGNSGQGEGNQGSIGGSSGSLSLTGRTIINNGGRLASPITTRAIRGKIVVRITVNAAGVVTATSIHPKGTTISDEAIRQATLTAARTTKFNPVPAESDQTGTITYNFDIK